MTHNDQAKQKTRKI